MKVKKGLLVAVVSLLTTCFCMIPFSSDVKALTQTPGTTTAYGYYSCQCYKAATSTYGEITIGDPNSGFGASIPFGAASSFFEFKYHLNDYYSGSITITITTNVNFILNKCSFGATGGWFHKGANANASSNGIPSLTTSSKTKAFIIDFYNTNELSLVIVSDNQTVFDDNTTFTLSTTISNATTLDEYAEDIATDIHVVRTLVNANFDYKLSDMADLLSDTLYAIQNQATYQFPIDMFPAWVFMNIETYSVNYSYGDFYPYYEETQYYSKYFKYPAGTVLYYYCIGTVPSVYGARYGNFNVTVEMMNNYLWTGKNKLLKYTITSVNNSNDRLEITPGPDSNVMIPLYFGDGRNMTQEMQSLLGVDSENIISERLLSILNAIESIYAIDLDDTNENLFNNGTDDVNDFVDTVQNYIPSINNFTNDMNTLPNFGNTFVNLSNYVQSVYVDITTAFPEIKWFVIMGLLVFLFGVVIR